MRNFTFSLRLFTAFIMCLVGRYAMAQDAVYVDGVEIPVVGVVTVPVDVVEQTAYSEDTATFDVDAVCEALGISDIDDADQYIINVTDNVAVENDGDAGFYDGWRDWQGDAAFYGSGDGMVCVKIQTPSSGEIDYIGCIDSAWEAGDQYTAIWGFVANGKAALVKVVITFVEDTSAKAPEAELDMTKLTVVGGAECSTERYSYHGYETTDCTVSVPGIATLLGVDAAEMEEWFADAVYVAYNNDNGIKVDSLQLLSITDGWLQRTCEDWGELGAGDMLDECCASDWSEACYYYIQEVSYDAGNDEVSFVVGNFPGNLEVGDSVYADLYIMNGEKAYVIRHHLICVEAPSGGGPADMTKVGEQTVEISQYPTNDFSYSYIYPNLDEAAALLGCEVSNLSLNALASATSFATYSSANQGGWWFSEAGYVVSYGSSSPFYIEPETSGDYSVLHIGQYPDYCDAGDVYSTSLYLVYGEKYYLLNVRLTVIEEEPLDWDSAEIVTTTTLVIAQEYDEDYSFSNAASIAFDKIEEAIGTADATLIGELAPEEAEENGGVKYTKSYTCTPYPGFWMTSAGYVTSWGDNSVWGMSVAYEGSSDELLFNCCQMPGYTADGDTYNGTFYLLNPENMKMMAVRLTYVIGETVEYENVGSADLTLYVSPDEDEIEYDFGMEDILEALDMTEDELMDTYCMCAAYGYTSTVTGGEGLTFGLDGTCLANGEGTVGFFIENGKMMAYTQEDIETPITVTVYIQFGTKRYTLNLTFRSTDDIDDAVAGIVAEGTGDAAIYDIAGRKVAAPRKGIYIIGGRKVLR